jgi:hypothetical protein
MSEPKFKRGERVEVIKTTATRHGMEAIIMSSSMNSIGEWTYRILKMPNRIDQKSWAEYGHREDKLTLICSNTRNGIKIFHDRINHD